MPAPDERHVLYGLAVDAIRADFPSLAETPFPAFDEHRVLFLAFPDDASDTRYVADMTQFDGGVFGEEAVALARSGRQITVTAPFTPSFGPRVFRVGFEWRNGVWEIPEIVSGVRFLNADFSFEHYWAELRVNGLKAFERSFNNFMAINGILVEDARSLHAAVSSASPLDHTALRGYVRALFALIEGFAWTLKQITLDFARSTDAFTPAELAALRDETYAQDKRGAITRSTTPEPLANFRFALDMAAKGFHIVVPEIQGHRWEALLKAKEIRHRLTHPKDAAALTLTAQDGKVLDAATSTLYGITIPTMEAIQARLRSQGYL